MGTRVSEETADSFFYQIERYEIPKDQIRDTKCHGKGKAIPITGRGSPQGCEMLRLPHFLDSRLTDGGKVVCPTRIPPITPPPPQEDSWYSFLLEA
jgi:hypothetical protein